MIYAESIYNHKRAGGSSGTCVTASLLSPSTDRPLKPRFRGHITLILDTNPKPNREETPPKKKNLSFSCIKIDFEVGISYHTYHQIRPLRPSTMVYLVLGKKLGPTSEKN